MAMHRAAEEERRRNAEAERSQAEYTAQRASFVSKPTAMQRQALEIQSRKPAVAALASETHIATPATSALSDNEKLAKDKQSFEMTQAESQALHTLGWTPSSWDQGDETPFDRAWTTFNERERGAARALGFDDEDFQMSRDQHDTVVTAAVATQRLESVPSPAVCQRARTRPAWAAGYNCGDGAWAPG